MPPTCPPTRPADNYTMSISDSLYQPQGMLHKIQADKYPCYDPGKVGAVCCPPLVCHPLCPRLHR